MLLNARFLSHRGLGEGLGRELHPELEANPVPPLRGATEGGPVGARLFQCLRNSHVHAPDWSDFSAFFC